MASRILFINNSADIYGASRCLVRLCQRLDRTRFIPLVLLPERGPLESLLRNEGIEFVLHQRLSVVNRRLFKSGRIIPFLLGIPIAAWELRKMIRRHQIDLVHTNVGTILSSALGATLASVPHVWHIRDWYGEFGSLWKWYRRYILTLSQRVPCVSRAIADQFPSDPKVSVVHDGFEDFRPSVANAGLEFRQKYNIDRQRFVIACVGRIKFVRKGQEFLVQALRILQDENIDSTLVIVGAPSPGSEDHLPRLRALITELGLNDKIIFTGELDDARAVYTACDVVVLPSAQPEPFGGVVVEAMCAAKAVVATAIGGSLDQVVDGQTGFLVPPCDPEALAGKLKVLAQNPNLREQMGHAGQSRARELFSVEGMVKKVEDIYSDLLSQ